LPETVLVRTTITLTTEVPYDEAHYAGFGDDGLMSKDEVIALEKEQGVEVLAMALEDRDAIPLGNPNLTVTTTVAFQNRITRDELEAERRFQDEVNGAEEK
jgi:hypothetical protein